MRNLLTIIFLLIGIVAFSQKKWTLEECLQYAAANNLQIKQAELSTKLTKNNYLQSKLNLLPSLSGDITNSYSLGNSINPTTYSYEKSNAYTLGMSLNGNLTLFAGLQQIHNIAKTKQDLLAAEYNYQNNINTTALTLTNQFLQILTNKELVKIAEEQLTISTNNLLQNKAKVKAGTLAEAMLYEYEAQVERDKSNLTLQKNNLDIAVIVMKIAMQLPDNEAFDIELPTIESGDINRYQSIAAEQIFQTAMAQQPAVKAAEADYKSAIYSEKIAKGALSPTISFGYSLRDNYFSKSQKLYAAIPYLDTLGIPIYANLTNMDPRQDIVGYDRIRFNYVYQKISLAEQLKNNLTQSVNVYVNIPIFNKWQRVTNISNAHIQAEIKKLQIETAKNNLKRDIYQAYANYTANLDNLEAAEKTQDASEKAYQISEKRLNAGLANFYEVQQSRNNLVSAESRLVQAKYNLAWSKKILDFYAGNLIFTK